MKYLKLLMRNAGHSGDEIAFASGGENEWLQVTDMCISIILMHSIWVSHYSDCRCPIEGIPSASLALVYVPYIQETAIPNVLQWEEKSLQIDSGKSQPIS
jgi:hypothetical protein